MANIIPIAVTAVKFTSKFETIPKRIELDGIIYKLDDDYKRVTLKDEEETTVFFDVSSGAKKFRLRQTPMEWSLVG